MSGYELVDVADRGAGMDSNGGRRRAAFWRARRTGDSPSSRCRVHRPGGRHVLHTSDDLSEAADSAPALEALPAAGRGHEINVTALPALHVPDRRRVADEPEEIGALGRLAPRAGQEVGWSLNWPPTAPAASSGLAGSFFAGAALAHGSVSRALVERLVFVTAADAERSDGPTSSTSTS